MNTKTNTARRIVSNPKTNTPATELMVDILVGGKPAKVKLSDLLAAQSAATATPAVKPAKATAPAIELLPIPSDAELILSAKVALCRKAGEEHAKKIAPWNGVKGAGSVGGKFSDASREAFKVGYNAQAKACGIEPFVSNSSK